MPRQTYSPQNPRFPGIVSAARTLGVSRIHLYYVLRGERKSPALLRRYQTLQQKGNQ